MARPDLTALAEDERRDLVDLLGELEPGEWETPSLCAAWTVRDVAAHVFSYDDLGPRQLAAVAVSARLRPDRMNEKALAPYQRDSPEQLLWRARARITPRGLAAGFRGGIALTDGMIHAQDIRRPLGRAREIPTERIVPALEFAVTAPTLGARKRIRHLQLIADDIGWTHGRGWVLRGPAEAVLMAVAGRPAALADLMGPGVPRLRKRLAGSAA